MSRRGGQGGAVVRQARARSPRARGGALSAAVIAVALALAGCRDFRFQAGLAQAPGINRRWTPEDFAHDVITNGDETCPRSGRAEDDPLFRRWPPCGGAPSPRLPPPRPSPPPARRPGPLAPLQPPDLPLDDAR